MKNIVTKDTNIIMKEAIDLLCNTVKVTLGPSGRNVIVDNDYMNPFITNDGVTIAREVEDTNDAVNVILNIAKEASIKTNEIVGDGTTTSLVLLQSIFLMGLEKTKEGYNKIKLKNEILNSIPLIVEEIRKESNKIKKDEIYYVAKNSCGDENLSNLIKEAYDKTSYNSLITVKEYEETSLEILNGYKIDSGAISKYMLKENKEEKFIQPYILVTNHDIKDINILNGLLNNIIGLNRSLVIICESMSEDVINTFTLNKHQNIINAIAVKAPSYGDNKNYILEDICSLTNAKFIDKNIGFKLENIKLEDLGKCEEIKVSINDTTIINNNNSNRLTKRIESLKEEIKVEKDKYNLEILNKRLSELTSGVALIKISANTKTELIEKKMRLEDALCAVKSAINNGVVEGGGITYLRVKKKLDNDKNNEGMKILLSSLEQPIKQIIINVGYDYEEILLKLKKDNYKNGYDALNNKYCNLKTIGIIDPTEVLVNAISNAASIAAMLLTTEVIIVNKDKKDTNFNELDNVY